MSGVNTTTARAPTWRGYVSDGWGIDANGKLFHQERPSVNMDERNRLARIAELFSLDFDAHATPGPRPNEYEKPGLFIRPIKGLQPSDRGQERVLKALDCLPHSVRAAWERSGRLEIVPGCNASLHPLGAPGRTLGFCQHAPPIIVVAGDHADVGRTLLHEIGHALDRLRAISRRPAWREICRVENARQAVHRHYPDAHVPAEYFADCCANVWSDSACSFSDASARFIMEVCR